MNGTLQTLACKTWEYHFNKFAIFSEEKAKIYHFNNNYWFDFIAFDNFLKFQSNVTSHAIRQLHSICNQEFG